MPPFSHLHVHSHYSPLDGVATVEKLISRAKELRQPAMAITDHGVMHGAVDFYCAAKKQGVKPLIGFEAYVTDNDSPDTSPSRPHAYNHLVLIAKNFEGYQNLCRLSSEGFLTGLDRVPQITKESLEKWGTGIVCLSGCLQGEVQRRLLEMDRDAAVRATNGYRDLFGKDNYYLEIMQNGLDKQQQLLTAMRTLSRKTGIPLVATADVHYVRPEDRRSQDVMMCIRSGKLLSDEKRMHSYGGCHVKSADEMLAALPGFGDAIENTMRIVDICDLELPLKGVHFPSLPLPDGISAKDCLSKLCSEGLARRYGNPLPKAVVERFEKERRVLTQMGFIDYFLVIWDIVTFAHDNDIMVGPGRGSAAGSIIAYGLGITNVDPLKYGLHFERFLNEGRNEMPDIDLDVESERQHEIIDHVIKRHSAERCAKIITIDRLSLSSGVRSVGRVMGISPERIESLAEMIHCPFPPENEMRSLDFALQSNPALAVEYFKDDETRVLMETACKLEGVIAGAGIHTESLLIADKNITDYAPLTVRDHTPLTQYEAKELEKFGLCKIDIMRLEMLSIIKNTIGSIRRTCTSAFDLEYPPLDHELTYGNL